MERSDDLSQLDQGLRDAGPSGRLLRYYLLRHFSELVQRLTCSLESDVQQPVGPEATAVPAAVADGTAQAAAEAPETDPRGVHGQGDDAELRSSALQVMEQRSLSDEDYVALWMDAVPVWGRSLVLCMAVTADGYRHMLAFADGTLQDAAVLQKLLQGVRKRGLCVDRGLLCITGGQVPLTQALEEHLGPHLVHQHCQIAKRERVVSFLAEKDRRSVRGAITRAFQLPEASEAHDALLRVHATLLQRNQSAARWLLQDLERTLTLHPTGLYEILSPSLRTTRSLVHTARQLFRQLRNLRHWLPPETRRAEWALWLLEKEARMRRMEHAGHLLPMRAALFTEDGRPRAS